MTHLTQLQLSMHADNALSADETIAITQHVESCTTCQARLAAVRDEVRFIASALQIEAPEESSEVVVPKFSRPMSLRSKKHSGVSTTAMRQRSRV